MPDKTFWEGLFALSIMGVLVYATVGWIFIPIISCLTGQYDNEKLKKRVKGLENKLAQYAPHVDWKTYKTLEEQRDYD